jgi:hypothetical protein
MRGQHRSAGPASAPQLRPAGGTVRCLWLADLFLLEVELAQLECLRVLGDISDRLV